MYIPKVFKCVMPVGLTEVTSNLGNNMKYGIYQISNQTFLSVYKTINGMFEKGYLTNNAQCNLQKINSESQTGADLSTVHDNCQGTIYKIANLTKDNIILDYPITVSQNDTATVLDQLYEVVDNRFSLGNETILGLEDCSPETANNALQQFKDYLISLIPTTTTTTTTTESPIDKGWDIKIILILLQMMHMKREKSF